MPNVSTTATAMPAASFESLLDGLAETLAEDPSYPAETLYSRYPDHCDDIRRLVAAARHESHYGDADVPPPLTSRASELHPTMIGPYRVIETLGVGGMGRIYRVSDSRRSERQFAAKVIRPELRGQTLVQRFAREQQISASLDHPYIARYHDAGETSGGVQFLVTRWINGPDLRGCVGSHLSTLPERLQIFVRICGAVDYLHHRGIVHRDLKPSNILLSCESGRPIPKLIDFGLAITVDELQRRKSYPVGAKKLMGTVPYMSPEQANRCSDSVDRRSDVYSLGVLLFEMSRGAKRHEDLLDSICGRATADRPQQRYASVGDLMSDVQSVLQDESP